MVNPQPGVADATSKTHALQFKDIPTPSNFSLQTEKLESYVQEAGSWRSGKLLYSGQGRALDAAAYFEERLPQHGWTLVNRASTPKREDLDWKKGDSRCHIEIQSESLGDHLALRIDVATVRNEATASVNVR